MKACKGILCGILWMVAAQLLFASSWAAIKFLGTRLPVMELVFFRGSISAVIILALTLWREHSLRGHNYRALFLRSLFGCTAMMLAFYAMTKMQIGNTATLFNTLPIFVALLAPAMLGEHFSLKKMALVLIAFVGIGMILKPGPDIFEGASLYALIAGFFGALSMIYVRKMATSDSTYIITLYFTAFTATCSAPFAFSNFMVPMGTEWGWIIFIGISLTLAQLFMTHAYKLGHASTIAPFSYTSVIGAYVLGLTLFQEKPDAWSIAGAAVVIGSGIGIMFTTPRTPLRERIRSAKVT